MSLRFLIVDGNDVAGRARQLEKLGRTAGTGYGSVIVTLAVDAACSICTPADADTDLPNVTRLREQFDAVVLTGSALHVWEGQPEVLRQIAFAKTVFESGLPFFGSCWGLQVATAAAGGDVVQNPRGREAGIARSITQTAAGLAHPLLATRPPVFDAPCIHLDTVITPAPGTIILASNDISDVQAAEIQHRGGTFWGVQYHPEFSLTHLARILVNNLAIHIEERRFADETAGRAYCSDLMQLCADPSLSNIAERHDIGPEVLLPNRRALEIANFINHRVRPYARLRTAA